MGDLLKDDCERSLQLAQDIAREAFARVREEWPDINVQNASIVTVLGFLSGMAEDALNRIMEHGGNTHTFNLFQHCKQLGALIGASDISIDDLKEGPTND